MLRTTEVVTGKNTRFSYLNANEPKPTQDGTRLKYSSSLIIPKSDVITKEKIEAAIRAAYEEGQSKLKGNGKTVPPLDSLKTPLRDGDTERPDDPVYANSWFMNANSDKKPKAWDANGNEIIDSSELYSGIYGKAVVNFYAYNTHGSKGIACGFEGLQKLRDGEHLGGANITADIFAEGNDDDDDDSFLQ